MQCTALGPLRRGQSPVVEPVVQLHLPAGGPVHDVDDVPAMLVCSVTSGVSRGRRVAAEADTGPARRRGRPLDVVYARAAPGGPARPWHPEAVVARIAGIDDYRGRFYDLELALSRHDFCFAGGRPHTRCLSDWSSDVCSSD